MLYLQNYIKFATKGHFTMNNFTMNILKHISSSIDMCSDYAARNKIVSPKDMSVLDFYRKCQMSPDVILSPCDVSTNRKISFCSESKIEC